MEEAFEKGQSPHRAVEPMMTTMMMMMIGDKRVILEVVIIENELQSRAKISSHNKLFFMLRTTVAAMFIYCISKYKYLYEDNHTTYRPITLHVVGYNFYKYFVTYLTLRINFCGQS